MPGQETLIAISIPLIFLGLLIGGISHAEDHSLQPGSDNVAEQIQQYDGEITITGSDSDQAENRFRGLVSWNMLAAQQCLYPVLIVHEQDIDEEDLPEEFQQDGDISGDDFLIENVGNIGTIDGTENNGLESNEFSFYSNDGNLIRDLIHDEEADFSGHCMGTNPIEIPDSATWSNLIPDRSTFFNVFSGFAILFQQYYIAAGFQLLDMAIDELQGDPTPLTPLEGESLQGNYGQTGFTVEESFEIEQKELFAMNLGPMAASDPLGGYNSPDFVRGDRASIFFPEGVFSQEGQASNWRDAAESSDGWFDFDSSTVRRVDSIAIADGEIQDSGFWDDVLSFSGDPERAVGLYPYAEGGTAGMTEEMHAFRVRMVNVPMVASDSFDMNEFEEENDEAWRDGLRYLVSNVDYKFCEGVEGHVRSNAGRDMEEHRGKEMMNDPPIYRDVVYPKVEITSQDADECVDKTPQSLQAEWIDTTIYT